MSGTITRWRYFFAHQDADQESWLDAQARCGLRLVRPGLFRFAFTQAEPRDEKYRIDFQMLRGRARDEYLGLFRDAGWEFLGQVASRYYFRARPDAFAPEIFTDADSKKARIRRQMRVCAILTALLAYQLSMGVTRILDEHVRGTIGAAVAAVVLAGAFTCLGVWVLWKMEQAYRRVT